MRFFILISFSLFLFGCPGPSASLLLMKNNEPDRSDWRYFASEREGIFRVNQLISPDSLNNLPPNTPIKIELRNELTVSPSTIKITQDSLFYNSNDASAKLSLSEISKILIFDKYTTQDFWITTGNSLLTGAAIANFPASSRDSFQEAGKSALIGGSIFIVLGNLLEYHTSKTSPVEVIFVTGIQEYKLE